MATRPKAGTTLILKRIIAAPRDKVFDAWTSPAIIRLWFFPEGGYSSAIAEVDLRIGGKYRIGIRHPDNKLHVATGVYREISKPERLVFTWSWEHDPIDTLVTLTFTEKGGMTEMVLKHEALPTPAERDSHEKGWIGCIAQLERMFAGKK